MYWPPEPTPKKGDTRQTTKFAFKPTEMTDGSKVWFEEYLLIEEYYSNPYSRFDPYWQVKKKRYIGGIK